MQRRDRVKRQQEREGARADRHPRSVAGVPQVEASRSASDTMSKHTCVFTNVPGPRDTVHILGQPVVGLSIFVNNILPQVTPSPLALRVAPMGAPPSLPPSLACDEVLLESLLRCHFIPHASLSLQPHPLLHPPRRLGCTIAHRSR